MKNETKYTVRDGKFNEWLVYPTSTTSNYASATRFNSLREAKSAMKAYEAELNRPFTRCEINPAVN